MSPKGHGPQAPTKIEKVDGYYLNGSFKKRLWDSEIASRDRYPCQNARLESLYHFVKVTVKISELQNGLKLCVWVHLMISFDGLSWWNRTLRFNWFNELIHLPPFVSNLKTFDGELRRNFT